MNIQIEKGIPFKPTPDVSDLPFDQMQPGDSFFVPEHKRVRISKALPKISAQLRKRFAARCVDGGTRVWCLEETPTRAARGVPFTEELREALDALRAVSQGRAPMTSAQIFRWVVDKNPALAYVTSAQKIGLLMHSGRWDGLSRIALHNGYSKYYIKT